MFQILSIWTFISTTITAIKYPSIWFKTVKPNTYAECSICTWTCGVSREGKGASTFGWLWLTLGLDEGDPSNGTSETAEAWRGIVNNVTVKLLLEQYLRYSGVCGGKKKGKRNEESTKQATINTFHHYHRNSKYVLKLTYASNKSHELFSIGDTDYVSSSLGCRFWQCNHTSATPEACRRFGLEMILKTAGTILDARFGLLELHPIPNFLLGVSFFYLPSSDWPAAIALLTFSNFNQSSKTLKNLGHPWWFPGRFHLGTTLNWWYASSFISIS